MSFESDTSEAAFAAFAEPCTLDGVDVESGCIIDRNVSYIDDEGQVRDRVNKASFLRADAAGIKFGQSLVQNGETFTIGRLEDDDGVIVAFEVHT